MGKVKANEFSDSKLYAMRIKLEKELQLDYKNLRLNTLADPIQTHSLTPVLNSELDDLKNDLRKMGAKSFRKVKLNKHAVILCFNAGDILN